MRIIKIFDTTLRDGEQSPGASMNVDEKIQMARQLVKLGVDVIEAGFPIASPGDFEAVKRIANEVQGTTIAGLATYPTGSLDRPEDHGTPSGLWHAPALGGELPRRYSLR